MSKSAQATAAEEISNRLVKCIVDSHEQLMKDPSLLPKDYSITGLVVRDQIEKTQKEKAEVWKQTMARLEREKSPLAQGSEFRSKKKG
jgi:hypothetical protein